ncbi:uncharacterized protein [Drosophila kikkawai]|uniref:Uncharacterized protein n=1 Tax=Drosophila kikkawai TaxID=30033 RepID=A0A6P4HVB8_DROKI|nr:serine/arginine repetitive matrix protein 2 [Drosophila kikkawai]
MKKDDYKVLSKEDPALQTTIASPRHLLQPNGHTLLRQGFEQTPETCEQKAHVKEVHIKTEPNLELFCEDLSDVLDELGEILEEEQADSAFDTEIAPPPPSFCLQDDTSLFTRRSNPDHDRSPVNIDDSLETSSNDSANKSKKDEFFEKGTTQIIQSPDSKSPNKPRSGTLIPFQERKPRTRKSSSKDTVSNKANRVIEANPQSPRPTPDDRRSSYRKCKTHGSSSGGHRLRSKDVRSGSDRQRNSRSPSKHKKSPVRSRDRRRSVSQNSKYCKPDQKRHRSKSSDRVRGRTRRRSSPRERLDRRPKSRCGSRSPHNMRSSDYIRYPHRERSRTRIHHRRNSSSSPRRSYDFRRGHFRGYSPSDLPRYRSRSRSSSGKISRSRRSRSRSPRLRGIRRLNQARILTRGRSRSTERYRSRSVSVTKSIDRPSNTKKGPRLGSRPPSLRIQLTSSRKSPSAQSPPLLDGTMTAVHVGSSYQASQSRDQRLQPMESVSPVSISPQPISPMVTLHDNRVSRRQLLPTPTPPHMFHMQAHFSNIEYRTSLSYQALGPPYNPAPANLGPFDLRHRLDTSRSLCYLGPNDLRHRIQGLCLQNTYLPPPEFDTYAQWPPDYTIDYSSSGYY